MGQEKSIFAVFGHLTIFENFEKLVAKWVGEIEDWVGNSEDWVGNIEDWVGNIEDWVGLGWVDCIFHSIDTYSPNK